MGKGQLSLVLSTRRGHTAQVRRREGQRLSGLRLYYLRLSPQAKPIPAMRQDLGNLGLVLA